ncbi:ABC transporter permease [Oscillochloris sp. ZM17-4]|uniref:ABC transporter permease n=1 Tax=Oscillochloris sp. ZM17-4 TaxID=2866714 RepID=UPI001C72ADAC|nr:ABC transporter permease [Oscillochloris sp. ZM17-4]MBX0330360.1 ABC transporter permease [Oscillochloris sp. ZM17-4]
MATATRIAPAEPSLPILEPLGESGSSTVGVGEVVRLAFDSLLANKMRAFLTMLGVIIGVGSVVALLSIGGGASAAITSSVASTGTNVLTIMPGSPQNRGPGSAGQAQTLTLADSDAVARLGLPIVGPAPQFGGGAQVIAPAADANATVTGITPAYFEINSLTLQSGSYLDESHVRGSSTVVVLGANLANDLFGSGAAVGQVVRIKGQSFRVIGVLNTKGSSGFGGSVDDRALVPISVAQQRLFGARTPDGNGWLVSSISISVPDADNIDSVIAQIQSLLRDRHRLSADGIQDDFDVFDQASLLSTLTTVTSLLTLFLGAVAAISLLVGGIGIMNIMLVSVSERTREIGLRKAVGARGRDILLQFVVEALVLSTAGGLIGLALGSSIPIIISLIGLLDAPVTWSTVVIAVGFAMAVGLFFGIYPARRAAQLNPIEALRHE